MSYEKVSIKELYSNPDKYADKTIEINAWVRQIRVQKKFGFIQLNDGSNFNNVQVVLEREKVANYDEIRGQYIGAALQVRGVFLLTPDARQAFEINADTVEVIGTSEQDYPLQPKEHTPEYLRSIAHIRPRSNTYSAVFKIRSEASYQIHKFFHDRDFINVHTPIITASDAEGAGQMFRVTTLDLDNPPRTEDGEIDNKEDFFGKDAYLTVSGQLNGEAYAQAFGKIYTFGPTFRAEHSYTARHAAEFWMIEPEIAFADLEDDMDLAEDMLKYIINFVLENAPEEIEFFNKFMDKGLLDRLNNIVNSDFERITYTKAIEILKEAKKEFKYPVEWGCDLQTEHERYITEEVYKKPVFVTDYPKDIKAFYMRLNDDGKTVAAMDLLVPGIGEIIGGSQREERLDVLKERIQEMGLNEEEYWWYLDLRKYGGVDHAGFGLGFERAVMYLTGISNIRDVIPFPRTVGNAEF